MKAKAKSLLPRGFKSQAEVTSLTLRSELKISPYQYLSAKQLAQHLGYQVIPGTLITKLLLDNALHISASAGRLMADSIEGMLRQGSTFSAMVFAAGGLKLILHNPYLSPARQESDIMHELGHVICKHDSCYITNDFGLALRSVNSQHEEEAAYLGSALQIPEKGLLSLGYKGLTCAQIAERFQASYDMVKYRWQSLGMTKRLKRALQ